MSRTCKDRSLLVLYRLNGKLVLANASIWKHTYKTLARGICKLLESKLSGFHWWEKERQVGMTGLQIDVFWTLMYHQGQWRDKRDVRDNLVQPFSFYI